MHVFLLHNCGKVSDVLSLGTVPTLQISSGPLITDVSMLHTVERLALYTLHGIKNVDAVFSRTEIKYN